MFRPKCPYCNGTNLYLCRTSPMEKYGCRDCDKKTKLMQENGMSKKDILKVLCTK